MSLSTISIRNPVMAWMLMAALIIFGAISFTRLGISQMPDVDFPVVSVSLSLPGAAPEVVESQVLDPIEDSIMEIDGIRNIDSTAQQSSGSISVEFEMGRDINSAMQEVQNHITQIRNLLPTNLNPAIVRKTNPEDQPILWLVLTAQDETKTKPIDLMIYARNFLFDQFSVVPGVGNVVLGGYVDPALRVWGDLSKLQQYDMTADDIVQSINQEHVEVPAGTIHNSENEYNVRFKGQSDNVSDFGKISVLNRVRQGPNYQPIQLKNIAKVEEGILDIRRISRFNKQRAIGLGIVKQHGSNAVAVAEAVRAKLKEITPLIPPEFKLVVRTDNTRFIRQSVSQLLFTLIMSVILTSLVCYLFLGSWSSTVNVLMAIPTSIIGAFMGIYFFGFTLNTFTMLGLSLAIGIVVDDAIMMLENIVRHQELGKPRKLAALIGANEITFSALAATLAIAAIFLPVIFMKGIIGRFFLQYGITVTLAVCLSLLEALTLTPMRCSRYLNIEDHSRGYAGFIERVFRRLSESYKKILVILLQHRIKTLIFALAIFVASIYSVKFINSEMMPAQDQSMFMIRIKTPVGTSLNGTDIVMKKIEEIAAKQPEIDGLFTTVGGFGGDAVNQAMSFTMMVPPENRKISQAEFIKKFRGILKKAIKGDAEVNVQDMSLRGFAAGRGFPIEIMVQGPNWQTLTSSVEQLKKELHDRNIAVDVNTDVQSGMPELKITPDRKKMAAHAVSVQAVTTAINELIGGAMLRKEILYPKDGHRYAIEFRLPAEQRDKIPDLNHIKLRNNRGELVSLSDVATQEVKPSLMLISRTNRSRAIKVYGNPAPGLSQQQALKQTEELARKILPPGYSLRMTGNAQSFKESFQSLIFALLFGILVSYMVLASQFNSFIHPVTILLALPFSISGAFLALLAFHQSINIYSMIGFILLMGIVKKNSILLVDFTNQKRSEGLNPSDALLEACPVRLRPILMTSIATVAGALPEALAIGPGSETTIPMAIAIIGGVIASTILTLFAVPCAYSLLAKWERKDNLTDTLV